MVFKYFIENKTNSRNTVGIYLYLRILDKTHTYILYRREQ